MVKDLISFIILTYRNFEGIYDTLDSVFIQDYPAIEIIISDDCSPQGEEYLQKIEKYIEDNKRENIVNVIVSRGKKNVGTVRNINRALKLANGEYIKDLGAEDMLADRDTLSKYRKYLDDSGCLICCSKVLGITEEGKKVYRLASCEDDYETLRAYSPKELRDRLFKRNCLPAPAFFVKKELYEKYGYYPEDTRLIEDYPYWLYLCTKGVKFAFIDERMIHYKLSGVSSGGHYGKAFMQDMFIIYEKYIFPFDHRFGIMQKPYNMLKKAGLGAYMALAEWEEYNTAQKLKAVLKYGVFLLYIKLNDLRYRHT